VTDWSKEHFEDYPTKDFDDIPLHHEGIGFDKEDDDYWACQFPERPIDKRHICYDWRCQGCLVVGESSLKTFGEQDMWWNYDGVAADDPTPLSWLVARGWYWYYNRGVTP
jgi:hypothetical protein